MIPFLGGVATRRIDGVGFADGGESVRELALIYLSITILLYLALGCQEC